MFEEIDFEEIDETLTWLSRAGSVALSTVLIASTILFLAIYRQPISWPLG